MIFFSYGALGICRPIAKIVANNLKLPSPALEGGGVAAPGDACDAPDTATYPVPLPMPPLQIENVEMATAALDAMHFSNYTSSPYAVQHHHLHHHHTLTLVTKDSGAGGGGGTPVANAVVSTQQRLDTSRFPALLPQLP